MPLLQKILPGQIAKFTRVHAVYRREELGAMSFDEVRVLSDDQDCNSPSLQILLVANVAVDRKEKIESLFRHRKQTPIVEVGPSHSICSHDLVA